MSLFTWLRTRPVGRRPARATDRRRTTSRLRVEALEDRSVPATFTAASVADLIADIKAANAAGGSNTIALAPGVSFRLNAVDNSADGPNGLPVIASGDNLTVVGNGATIQRSATKGTPAFRLFEVAPGASLGLQNLTLQGGLALHPSYSLNYTEARGGAVYNQGTLTLSRVTVQNNTAQGERGEAAAGAASGRAARSSSNTARSGATRPSAATAVPTSGPAAGPPGAGFTSREVRPASST
jgi:hypothetical protein